jgi:hypothetical protein
LQKKGKGAEKRVVVKTPRRFILTQNALAVDALFGLFVNFREILRFF